MNNQTTATVAKTGEQVQAVNQVRSLEGGKFLTFLMANEKYGLEILKVREIIGIMDVTPVPTTPAFVRGVINLRGKVIPVVDLRLKFGMEAKENTERTCIIVVHLARAAQEVITGILVDEVSEVLDIDQDQIEPPPSFGVDIRTDFILGMGKVDQKVLTLLDIDRVLTEQEISLVESPSGKKGH
jgi:purine-binding chemotaxis protein CheW